MAITVLSASRDTNLLKTRNEALSRNGCVVTSALSSSDLVNRFFEGDYDLMVVCHTIPVEERQRLLRLAKHYRPSLVVIMVNDHAAFHHPVDLKIKELRIPPNPEALVSAVNSVFPRLPLSA